MTAPSYVFPVERVHRVVDGDTCWVYVQLGFRQLALVELRLDGIDCPETHRGSPFERAQGAQARSVTADYLTRDGLWVATQPDPDKYGRWLARVWRDGQPDLQSTLLGLHLAVPSDGSQKWRTVYDQAAS